MLEIPASNSLVCATKVVAQVGLKKWKSHISDGSIPRQQMLPILVYTYSKYIKLKLMTWPVSSGGWEVHPLTSSLGFEPYSVQFFCTRVRTMVLTSCTLNLVLWKEEYIKHGSTRLRKMSRMPILYVQVR